MEVAVLKVTSSKTKLLKPNQSNIRKIEDSKNIEICLIALYLYTSFKDLKNGVISDNLHYP